MFRLVVWGWLLLVLGFPAPAGAQVFTCRDADGRLYAGDNLQSLPESCRTQVRQLPEESAGNLNYVPGEAAGLRSSQAFDRQVMRATQELSQRQQREQALLKRAQEVVTQYREAESQKWAARKDMTTRSRGAYDEAQQKQQQLIRKKADILDELNRGRYSADSREKIISDLKSVGAN